MKAYDTAVVGATGAVGQEMIKILGSRNFPIKEITLLASKKSAGKKLKFKGKDVVVEGSTIQMVVVLKPLHDVAQIKRIVVSSYQSVSGWGREAMEQLHQETVRQLGSETAKQPNSQTAKQVLPYQIAFNVIPQIDDFITSGYTKEEMKLVNETRKIMEDDSIQITATCVRVPVYIGHSEAINIETERKLTAKEAKEILSQAPGVKVIDEPKESKYPIPIDAAGKDETFVGRIREDESIPNGLNLWVVSDNLRKGAALNTIQIAELLIKKELI